jgi:tripartite-type tricarboxylate transporter receptor subunit TctC
MTTSGIQAINPVLYPKMQYDPNKDLAPIAVLVSLANVLVVNPAVKANSVTELIALAKAQPGKMTYASSGSGTSIHMSAELFKQLTKIDIVHVPYKGSAPALTDLIGGQVNLMFDNIPSALPHIKAGRLNALATTGARRDPTLPDLPTVAESGLPGFEMIAWTAVFLPAGTPEPIVIKLNKAIGEILRSAEFRQKAGPATDLSPGTPQQLDAFVRSEIDKWKRVVAQARLEVE